MKRTWTGLSGDNTRGSQPQRCPHCRLPRRLTALCSAEWRCPEQKGVKRKTTSPAFTLEGIGFLLLHKQSQVHFLETAGRKSTPQWSGRCGFPSPFTAGILGMARTLQTSMSKKLRALPVACKFPAAPSGHQQKGGDRVKEHLHPPTLGWREAKAPSPCMKIGILSDIFYFSAQII